MNGQHDLFRRISSPEVGQPVHDGLRLIDRSLHHRQDLIGHRDRRDLPVVRRRQAEGVEYGGGVGPVVELSRRMYECTNGGAARLQEPPGHIRQFHDRDEPDITGEWGDMGLERQAASLEAVGQTGPVQELKVPLLHLSQSPPACSVVEENARTADLHHIPERVTLTCQCFMETG